MTEREQRLQCLYFGRQMKLGQSVTISEFAKGAGVGIDSVVDAIKFIKPFAIAESWELEFTSDMKNVVKKKSFDEIFKDEFFAWQDRVAWNKKILNLR